MSWNGPDGGVERIIDRSGVTEYCRYVVEVDILEALIKMKRAVASRWGGGGAEDFDMHVQRVEGGVSSKFCRLCYMMAGMEEEVV